MGKQYDQMPAKASRADDVKELAGLLFANAVAAPGAKNRDTAMLAADAIRDARAFFRAWDESPTKSEG